MSTWRARCPGEIRPLPTRRGMLQQTSAGFGFLALRGMSLAKQQDSSVGRIAKA